jgi:hypothetical protein
MPTYYLVHDYGDDDPTETRRFPYESFKSAQAQRDHDAERYKNIKLTITDEDGKEVKK